MLEKRGVEVTRLTVDKNGLVSLDQLKKAINAKFGKEDLPDLSQAF